MADPLFLMLTNLVNDCLAIELRSVVYIFHKCIISWVLSGYEVIQVQMNMWILILRESPPLRNDDFQKQNTTLINFW